MANDPVLQRSMFQKQGPSVTPAVGLGTGIGSVTTPDQNAQALRNMFQPTVSIGAPTDMLQQGQPVQSFQEGGLAQLLPQYTFREPRNFRLPPSYLERTDPARFEAERPAREAAAEEARARTAASLDAQRARYRTMEASRRQAIDDADARTRPFPAGPVAPDTMSTMEGFMPPDVPMSIGATVSPAPAAPRATPSAPPPIDEVIFQTRKEASPPPTEERKPPREDSLQLTLKEIKAERAADRRENALLALMQAGFAIAGGRSPNAITNIGAGGQAGIGAFAAMERASREDAAARRREAIQLASAERQFALAERQLEKDPEAIRTYALLGGWTPDQGRDKLVDAAKRGFDFMQTKEAPARAEALLKAAAADPLRGTPGALLSPEETRRLSQFLYGSVAGTLAERGGRSGQPSGPQTFRLDELPRSR